MHLNLGLGCMLWAVWALAAVLWLGGEARGDDGPAADVASGWTAGYYAGVAANGVHHTGYVPGTVFNAEKYAVGGKIFGGYQFAPWGQIEVAYHYLGQVSFAEGLPFSSKERSHAISGSFLFVTHPISTWLIPTFTPVRLLLRTGLAYKHIAHNSTLGSFEEGVAAGLVGVGWQFEITERLFARVEYEFLTPAIGGTNRAINVMHTPLSVVVGAKF